eukprot:Ihof_evm10s48 gene=Ihof_evmTU10s48
MDKLLKGVILASPDKIPIKQKPIILKRILGLAAKATARERTDSLVLAKDWLCSMDGLERACGLQTLVALAPYQREATIDLFGARWIASQLQQEDYVTSNQMENIYTALLAIKSADCPQALSQCITVIRGCTRSMILKDDLDEGVRAHLFGIYLDFPDCIPDFTNLMHAIIIWLARSPVLTNEKGEKKQRLDILERHAILLAQLWNNDESTISISLMQALNLLIGHHAPSPILQLVLQHIPTNMTVQVTQAIATSTQSEESVKIAAARIVTWAWQPLVANLDQWVIAVIKGILLSGRHNTFCALAESSIEPLCNSMKTPEHIEISLSVATFLLVHYREGPYLFHKVVLILTTILDWLLSRPNTSEWDFLKEVLSEISFLISAMMGRYSGYPELYGPLVQLLDRLPSHTSEEGDLWLKIKENAVKVQQYDWKAENNKRLEERGPITRSKTGRAGLVNMGNTCYMNSVLQVLYMSVPFRNFILFYKEPPTTPLIPLNANSRKQRHGTITKLQTIFAQLTYTILPAIEPHNIISLFTPPWFTRGAQQDCDEFLKYLLDIVDENWGEMGVYAGKLDMIDGGKEDKNSTTNNNGLINGKPIMNTAVDVFTGERIYKITCCTCLKVSHRKERFTDLTLSFPAANNNTIAISLGNTNTVLNPSTNNNTTAISIANTSTTLKPSTTSQTTTAEEIATHSIHDNDSINHHFSTATPSHLPPSSPFPFPAHGNRQSNTVQEDASSALTLPNLIEEFLKPEYLIGENQYDCSHCMRKCDAVSRISLVELPECLVMVLKRFYYDSITKTILKIKTKIDFPLVLSIPSHTESSNGNSNSEKLLVRYFLYGVIFHAGNSFESGHYYSAAREISTLEAGSDSEN